MPCLLGWTVHYSENGCGSATRARSPDVGSMRRVVIHRLSTSAGSEASSSRIGFCRPFSTEFDAPCRVHIEQAHGRAPCRRQAGNVSVPNHKVLAPGVGTRAKQCHHGACAGIDARKIRPFVCVAAVTRERQSAGIVCSSVLPRNDMFDIVRQGKRSGASPAAACGSTHKRCLRAFEQFPEGLDPSYAGCLARKRRAFACMIEIRSTASTKSLYSASSPGVRVPSLAF